MIKRLTKDELAEGLTPEFVNSVNMDKCCSPVQMEKGDEPVRLLVATKGYMILLDDKPTILSNANDYPILFKRRKCHIARARYLMNFNERDKKRKVQTIVEACRQSLLKRLVEIAAKITQYEHLLASRVQERLTGQGSPYASVRDQSIKSDLEYLTPKYKLLEVMWDKGELMYMFDMLQLYFSFPPFEFMQQMSGIDIHGIRGDLTALVKLVVEKEHKTYFK